MKEEILIYLEKFDSQTKIRFTTIYELILESTTHIIEEKLWAKLPSFYVNKQFVRIIPFKDHLNIEASAVNTYKALLSGYKITPKGMLQLFHTEDIPKDVLKQIFKESLEK